MIIHDPLKDVFRERTLFINQLYLHVNQLFCGKIQMGLGRGCRSVVFQIKRDSGAGAGGADRLFDRKTACDQTLFPPGIAVDAKHEVGGHSDAVEDRFAHLFARGNTGNEADHENGQHDADAQLPHLFHHRPDEPEEEGGPGPALLHRLDRAGRMLEDLKLLHADCL